MQRRPPPVRTHLNTRNGSLLFCGVGACSLRSSGRPSRWRFSSQYSYTATRMVSRDGHVSSSICSASCRCRWSVVAHASTVSRSVGAAPWKEKILSVASAFITSSFHSIASSLSGESRSWSPLNVASQRSSSRSRSYSTKVASSYPPPPRPRRYVLRSRKVGR